MRKLSDVTMDPTPLTMSEPATDMEASNPLHDCHAGTVLATGDDARGTLSDADYVHLILELEQACSEDMY
jgi:hypothetical protein